MQFSEEARKGEITMTMGEFQDAVLSAVSTSVTGLLKDMAEQILEAEKEGEVFRSGADVAQFLNTMAKHASDPDLGKAK